MRQLEFRSIMNNPMGAEKVPELVNQRIPFLCWSGDKSILSDVRRIKTYLQFNRWIRTNEFTKGYQNEGHDSAHPDYGAIGQRPGGEQALNQW